MIRALIRRIVDNVADGQKYYLKVVFSDGSEHHSTRIGDPDVTIIFRNRRAERRMVLGGVFEFLESYWWKSDPVGVISRCSPRRSMAPT